TCALPILADVADAAAGGVLDPGEDLGRPAHLAGDGHVIRGRQRLAGDTRFRVGSEIEVEHRVGNAVADLVGMPLGYALAGEEPALLGHGSVAPLCRLFLVRHADRRSASCRWSGR